MTTNAVLILIARRKQKASDDFKSGLINQGQKITILAELMALEKEVVRA